MYVVDIEYNNIPFVFQLLLQCISFRARSHQPLSAPAPNFQPKHLLLVTLIQVYMLCTNLHLRNPLRSIPSSRP